MDCLFCEIANGNIPSTTLYEDDTLRVIFDINPASYGHSLIIPKEHYPSLLECPDDVLARVFSIAGQMGRKMEKELECSGINIIANCRPGAGQTIDHFHVHVIPRFAGQPEKDALIIEQKPIEAPDFEALAAKLAL